MEVSYFFRKRRLHAFSIEMLFDNIRSEINRKNQFATQKVEVPALTNVFSNILNTTQKQSRINHITGDIHYV
ncbi:MAG: hypothetical protein ACK5XN_34220, partial [Bacteroidota bacterium]